MDARRISDDRLVLIKQVVTGSQEERIARFLSSPEMLQDPRNHCVPILDVLRDPNDHNITYLIMPFLRYIDKPPFETVEELLECGEQILEVCRHVSGLPHTLIVEPQGLVFLHENGVAHRYLLLHWS